MDDVFQESDGNPPADKKRKVHTDQTDNGDADRIPAAAPTPHTSELDVLLRHGWRRVECGGQGECGYLINHCPRPCVASARVYDVT